MPHVMMRYFYPVLFFMFFSLGAFATHERAGEITYRHIEGYTYEVTILTYTYAPSPADRPELEILWGDGTASILPRVDSINLTNLIRKNIYIGQHTYSGQGTYILSMEDPNRNAGILNIPNSVNIPFYIQTQLVINPYLGYNNSVQLINPPLDQGCVDRLFLHNPGAYDLDGDSIAYKLTVCRGEGGLPIPGYTYPNTSNIFIMDSLSGNLIWDSPIQQGEYNVAFIIEEWRSGQMIGYVTRDLQIQIGSCNNNPPEIFALTDTCISAGENLTFDVMASDPDGSYLSLTAFGGPFNAITSPAYIDPDPATGLETVTTTFFWQTDCLHVRKNPHQVFFKAVDEDSEVSLTAYHTTHIQVNGPPPENLDAIPEGTAIYLSWIPSPCTNATGFNIYRKEDYYGFVHDYCETGVPAYTGYELIASINNTDFNYFTDNNNGAGLFHGINYCYMVTEVYGDGAESYASNEACASLQKDMPVFTNVSVNNTDKTNGSMYVAWSKPTEIDFDEWPGPFQYHLYRREDRQDAVFEVVQVYYNLNDTIFIDTLINTLDYRYLYYIDFYHGESGALERIGTTPTAPSTYLTIQPSDSRLNLSWNNDTPWSNDSFVIYKKSPGELFFDSIGFTTIPSFADTDLLNGELYCYYVKTIGQYSLPGTIDPIINFSQENCARPVDNVPPCTPLLDIETDCDLYTNDLYITYPDECADEEVIYYIYYSQGLNDTMMLIDSTYNSYYLFETDSPSIVGCFAVSSLDSLWNESPLSETICIPLETCDITFFPDIITPNGDNFNEIFRAYNINSVESMHIVIFNRWGSVVFESSDPYFEWNGIDQSSGRACSDGVYFFVANLTEKTLGGSTARTVKSSLTILR